MGVSGGQSLADPSSALTDAVREIWERRKADVMASVEVVEHAVAAILAHGAAGENRQAAVRAAHQLAGSVGMFGFETASEVAREIELVLESGDAHDADDAKTLAVLVAALRDGLESDRPGGAPSARPAPTPCTEEEAQAVILLLTCAPEISDAFTGPEAPTRLRAVSVATLAEALSIPALDPVAVVLDLRGAPTAADELALLEDVQRAYEGVATLILTERADFSARIDAARRGVTAVLDATRSPRHFVEAVVDVVERQRRSGVHVLAVDDDPTVLDVLTASMAPAGIGLRTLQDPRDLFSALDEDAPDLLLLDFDLPGASGAEVCRALRSDPRWESLPVVFLSSHAGPDTMRRVFEAGGDDFLTKPFDPEELLARITNRFERTRSLRRHADTDPLTGLANRRRSVPQIDRFLRTAARSGAPVCLVVLDLDHFKQVNDRFGHAAGDQVLRSLAGMLTRELRSEDVVARWGGEEFVIVMQGVTKADCVRRVEHLQEVFRGQRFNGSAEEFSVTASAGVAQFPGDGTTTTTLYESADRALYLAKASGRDRVCGAEDREGSSAERMSVDVVLVEDDELLADLVLRALESRGWSTYWMPDGRQASEALIESVTARVVILDWDLPGLDGVSVLRRLATTNALRSTRVIMLTGRSSESEILETLRLGASDHVAKPCSVPVLMELTRKALGH